MKWILIGALAARAFAQPMPLSLEKAVAIAVAPDGNLRLEIVRESIAQAAEREKQARAAFLPQVDGSISAASQTRNLLAFGFQVRVPGISIATFVGPFTVVDYRASATQSILDLASIRRLSAAKLQKQVAQAEAQVARESAVAQTARLYTLALRAEAAVSAAEANLKLAERLHGLALAQKEAGTGTGLEVTRAQAERENSQQRLLEARNRSRRAFFELKRGIGMDLGQEIALTSRVNDGSEAAPDEAETLRTALEQRAELLVQARRKSALELQVKGIRAERFPSIVASGDYGSIGDGAAQLPTRSIGVGMRVPLFDGGRREARRAEVGIAVRQERLREEDLRAQVELEVRTSLDNWRTAKEQIAVARLGLQLAEEELQHAERRFAAGVAINVELSDAQARLERARDNQLNALYQFNLARIDVAAASGGIEEAVKGLSK
jgi:outer membrane protein TolC